MNYIWQERFDDTIEENIGIYNKIKALLSNHPRINVSIVVFPFLPEFVNKYSGEIQNTKDLFYDLIGSDYRIIDDFASFKSNSFFMDHCHLNKAGRFKYTEYLKSILND